MKSDIFKVGEIKLNESYFGAKIVRSNVIELFRWEAEIPAKCLSEMLERGEKVYTQVVILLINRYRCVFYCPAVVDSHGLFVAQLPFAFVVVCKSVVFANDFKSYDELADYSYNGAL